MSDEADLKRLIMSLPTAPPPVIEAPWWLKERMERLRQYSLEHPPTLEQVRAQLASCREAGNPDWYKPRGQRAKTNQVVR